MELVRHETCREYFNRRLSEGWKCISLKGYNAILLSPEGIRRELDLRNDVEILRPNAAGDYTNIASQIPDTGEHWDKVDEEISDGDDTCVYPTPEIIGKDAYNLTASTIPPDSTINSVTVYSVVRSAVGHECSVKLFLRLGVDETEGTLFYFSSENYLTKSEALSRPGGGDWSAPDLADLQVAIELTSPDGTGVLCTQVYVEVDYTPPPVITPPTVTALPASAITATTARPNGELTSTGGENPIVHIYWGTSDGETAPGDWDHDENLGELGIGAFYKDISSLTCGTKYYYRCYAANSGGSDWSDVAEFTTLLEKPVGASNAATTVGVTAATLNGTVTDDGGGSCQYRFRYKKAGGDYLYTDWTGAKATGETFSKAISGLDASSTYYFNAQVKNSQFESDWGAELTFNTGAVVVAPTGTTDPATLVADIEATLNGEVTGDGGEACEVRFQYGLAAPAYGTNTAWQPGKLTGVTFLQKINGLTPNTTYHFRAQIRNSAGTANGADETFTTEYFPTPFLRRVLRDVFGGGSDIGPANPLQVYDPAVAVGVDELLNSAMVLAETGGTVTTTALDTEYDVYINDDPAGEYRPEKVVIDFSNQTVAETTVIREYYRIKEGGDYIKKDGTSFIGVQDPALINIELEPNRFGIKVTIERTAGNAKAYDWETHYAD